jgi:aminodeoxyfutalosine synthase
MDTSTTFDRYMERIESGEPMTAAEIGGLATTPDILPLGMLADTWRRRQHGARTTFLRVATVRAEAPLDEPVPAGAREIRIAGSPTHLRTAIEVVSRVKAAAGERTVAAFSWGDVERLAATAPGGVAGVLTSLRTAGLDSFADLAMDRIADLDAAIESLVTAGFGRLRLTVDTRAGSERTDLFIRAGELHQRFSCVQAISPLPTTLATFRPTTGYEDVKTVAIARLSAPAVPTIQVDWVRYGPKLAQVALTFGADDIDGVSGSDEAPEGRRRAPLEEIRRNIEAAGYSPIERDGRFAALA